LFPGPNWYAAGLPTFVGRHGILHAMDTRVSTHLPARPTSWRDPVVEAYKPGVDRTLLRRNLRLSVEQRLVQLEDVLRDCAEIRKAGQRALGR
jgi:hypothetical protein